LAGGWANVACKSRIRDSSRASAPFCRASSWYTRSASAACPCCRRTSAMVSVTTNSGSARVLGAGSTGVGTAWGATGSGGWEALSRAAKDLRSSEASGTRNSELPEASKNTSSLVSTPSPPVASSGGWNSALIRPGSGRTGSSCPIMSFSSGGGAPGPRSDGLVLVAFAIAPAGACGSEVGSSPAM
jgi:hypothetical protein